MPLKFEGELTITSISIPKSLKTAIDELAKEEDRDFSNQIEFMVKRDLEINYAYREKRG
jgi:hypothetical protein